jgi:hypothetical protein
MSFEPTFSGGAPTAPVATNYIQPNLGHGLRIWWAFFWRNTGIAFLIGAFFGAALMFLSRANHFTVDPRFLTYGGYVLEYITAIFVMHFIVQKKFRGFRIILTPANTDDSSRILPPIFRRTVRIWWTFAWRSAVYRVALTVAMSVPLGVVTGAVAGISPQLGQFFTWAMGVAVSGAVGLFTIYSNILDEDIAGFRVSLAPRTTAVWPEEILQVEPSPGAPGAAVS